MLRQVKVSTKHCNILSWLNILCVTKLWRDVNYCALPASCVTGRIVFLMLVFPSCISCLSILRNTLTETPLDWNSCRNFFLPYCFLFSGFRLQIIIYTYFTHFATSSTLIMMTSRIRSCTEIFLGYLFTIFISNVFYPCASFTLNFYPTSSFVGRF